MASAAGQPVVDLADLRLFVVLAEDDDLHAIAAIR
jgi:hypothetical protein